MRLKLSLTFAAVLGLTFTAASHAQAADDATHGKEIFTSKCALCHNADSTESKIGPGLKGLYARGTMADGSKVTDESVTGRIVNGKVPMPAFKDTLTPAEIKQVVEYLKTL
jgi:mono/diheme cytochrome c family protein